MKLLLCVADIEQIKPALVELNYAAESNPLNGFVHTTKILHHEVDILETGVGLFQTTYKVTKALSKQKYHLALKVAMGNSYNADIPCGTVLNVVNEKPGDFGSAINGEWQDIYDLNLLKRESEPHARGGFINLTNAYMNVFGPFKKVVGLTVNNYAAADAAILRREKYRADCETGDGLGFVYPCLYEKQNFYQLCVIERNLVTGLEDFETAARIMNETIVDLIKKL